MMGGRTPTVADLRIVEDVLLGRARQLEEGAYDTHQALDLVNGQIDRLEASGQGPRLESLVTRMRELTARHVAQAHAFAAAAESLRRLFQQAVMAGDDLRAATARDMGLVDTPVDAEQYLMPWRAACRRTAEQLGSIGAMVPDRAWHDPLRFAPPDALGTLYAAGVQGAPIVEESWIVTVARSAEFGAGVGTRAVFEVRRLSNGRYEVAHRADGSIYAEGGAELSVGLRTGTSIVGIDASATASSRLRIEREETYSVADEHDLKLLITGLALQDLGIGETASSSLPAPVKLALISPVNQALFGFFSDRGEDAGLPNVKENVDELLQYEPNLTLAYFGLGSEYSARASVTAGISDLLTPPQPHFEAIVDRAWGDLTGAAGEEGMRVTLTGTAIAELSLGPFDLADENHSAVAEVEWLIDPDTREHSSVTAVVTTFGQDSLTTRTTTFDLTTESGRAAAHTIVRTAEAPVRGGAFSDGALRSLELIAQDPNIEGVKQSVKEYAVSSGDHGVFVDLSFGLSVGVDFNVHVTHLE